MRRRAARDGYILASVLICIVLAVGLLRMLLVHATSELQAARRERIQLQCRQILQSGIELAEARLAAQPDLRQFRWTLSPQQLGGRYGAELEFQVAPSAAGDVTLPYQVTVVAIYPAQSTDTLRLRRKVTISRP